MASASEFRRLGSGLLAIASTAVLLWFGTGLNPHWPLMWFAPLPALLFAPRASWWSAALVAGSAWILGSLNMWHYDMAVINIPPPIVVRILITIGLVFAISVLLHRALLRRGAHWTALLAFPAFLTSFEYLLNIGSPHGTAGSLAYSQVNFLPFLQLASITGPWGMTFLLLLFPCALALGLHLRTRATQQALAIVGVSLSVIALVLMFGAVRLLLPAPTGLVRVGLMASDPPVSPFMADEGVPTTRLLQTYADHAVALAAQGAQVIVMPEKIGVLAGSATQDSDVLFNALADKTHATIVVGSIRVADHKGYNEARVYAPAAPVLSYDKQHMLPAFESNLTPGTTLTLLPRPSGVWGVAICKDMDFTPLSREYGQAGVGLLLVPAWDFDLDRLEHGHMAVMRGVESGFNLVRAAKQGYLTVSDYRGRILAETTSDSAPFAVLIADVPANHVHTLYVLLGDWFAWLALAVLVVTLVQLARAWM
jgi:apolipoprotein N-acyltransferase